MNVDINVLVTEDQVDIIATPTVNIINVTNSSTTSWGLINGTLSNQTDLQSALNAKQDTLISGTSIKTLEGQSILGSGNIDLTKSDVGLSNVDNTSDVNKPVSTATQTALNAKQDTLVSGTNIKTVFNQSVVGAGNIGYLHRTFTQGSNVTGTTSEVQVFQLLIPANTFSTTDKLAFFAVFSRVTAATLVSLRAKISTSVTMPSGATGMIARLNPAALNVYAKISREMIISGGNVRGINNNTTNATDAVTSTSVLSSQVMDVTVDNYFYLSVQLTASTDDVRLEAVEIKTI